MVGAGRLELPTSPTRKERSTVLSYAPTTQFYPIPRLSVKRAAGRPRRRAPTAIAK